MCPRELFPGIFELDHDGKRDLATVNLTPGRSYYGEPLIAISGEEYRVWNPFRSKLPAAIIRGLKQVPVSKGDKVLYLGVASGTTCTHISDIVGEAGHIWGVDFAPRPLRDLIENVSSHRRNVSPILGDARRPETYSALVPLVDLIYADVAQPDQSGIVAKNAEFYLKPGGWAMLAMKSRSVDVTKPPKEVYEEQTDILRQRGFVIEETVELDPYERDHAMVVARYRC